MFLITDNFKGLNVCYIGFIWLWPHLVIHFNKAGSVLTLISFSWMYYDIYIVDYILNFRQKINYGQFCSCHLSVSYLVFTMFYYTSRENFQYEGNNSFYPMAEQQKFLWIWFFRVDQSKIDSLMGNALNLHKKCLGITCCPRRFSKPVKLMRKHPLLHFC